MCLKSWFVSLFILLFATIGFAQEPEIDIEGSKDYPLMSRLPGYFITEYTVNDFDSYTSPYFEKENVWEGQLTKIAYTAKEVQEKKYSPVQIVRNYENAVKKLGGRFFFQEEGRFGARIDKDGAVLYLEVSTYNEGRIYQLLFVESKQMQDEVVIDAAAMNSTIAQAGKIAVYGIHFDTGKAVIKPESEPTLAQMVALLQQNPSLKLSVVGHTDSAGQAAANMKLSADRAAAVVAALTGKGITAARLTSAGVGSYCPVASNRTEDGKAQNRRVELVEMAN